MAPCFTPELINMDTALARLLEQAVPLNQSHTVSLGDAAGRILAQDVPSPIDTPPFNSSVMDGYAFNSHDLEGPGPWRLPIEQHISAGHPGQPLTRQTAARILTGAAVPEGADTVVPQEQCKTEQTHVVISTPVDAGAHIRPRGCHLGKGTIALHAGARLGPTHIGLAASLGLVQLPVVRRLKVGLLNTGDELVTPGQPLQQGQIYNTNSPLLATLVNNLGCELLDMGTVADNAEATRHALQLAAADSDIIITSGGVSVGDEDHVKNAVAALGRLEMWRIRLKPGKPFAFGFVHDTPFLGLPGNPLSSFTTFCLFARPFILKRQGARDLAHKAFTVSAGFDRPKAHPRREYIAARLERDGNNTLIAVAPPRQDSAALLSSTTADGLLCLPEETTIVRGDPLMFIPYSELLS